jgi:hypothetical protein
VYWNGLYFNSFHENNILKHGEVSHAGLNRIADAAHPANIAVGVQAKVSIENSVIKNSLGYGLITATLNNINSNFSQVNQFSNLQSGIIFPAVVDIPENPSIAGTWLDISSFMDGESFIADNFYNKDTGVWFEGAANPWAINSGGFGMYIDEAGNFTWIIAERHPVIGCESYSAEYITGTATIFSDKISFDQTYWISKFINSCDETQNVETEVTPFEVLLRYDISRIFNPNTGGQLWELKFYNPDNSTFSYYRR